MSRSEAMILFYVSVVITIFFAENCKTFNITNNDTESAPTIHIIEAWLRIPVRNIPYVNVMLRVQNHKQDAENPYIQWFLKQSLVPYTLSSYDSMNSSYIKSIHLRSTPDRGSYVIVTDMQKLRVTVSNYAQRSGTFFFVLTNRTEWLELRNICHDLWTNFRIVQNFILNSSGVFIYDPFAKNERGYYGQIIKYTGEYSLERTLFHNMRGYPLRAQIFQSVYSRPILNPVTNNIEYVHGLDGKVAEMLEKHMNFSMRLLEPDPDYFGYV